MLIIAGPCAAESRNQVLNTAHALAGMGVSIFRASVWKPRTRCGTFEGVGSEGLQWLSEVRKETKLAVATEIRMPRDVDQLVKHNIDVAWIGARSSCNPFLMNEFAAALAGSGLRVMVKNPICPDVDLWVGGMERLMAAGVNDLTSIHRGFMQWGYQGEYRNAPLWELADEFRRRMPNIPLVVDPSHIAGRASLIEEVAAQGLSHGANGLMVEVHPSPCDALSDAAQQLTPMQFRDMMARLNTTVTHSATR